MSRASRDRAAARERLQRRRIRGKLEDEGVVLTGGVTPEMVRVAHAIYIDTIESNTFPFSDLQMVATMLAAAIGERDRQRGASAVDESNTYFITDGDTIKIGKAVNVASRLASLQTSHPKPLSVLGIVAGGDETERWFHAQFAAHRIRGEWFANDGVLAEFVGMNFPSPGAVVSVEKCILPQGVQKPCTDRP